MHRLVFRPHWHAVLAIGIVACTSKAPADTPSTPAPVEAPMTDPADSPQTAPEPQPQPQPGPKAGDELQIDIDQRVAIAVGIEITFTGHTHKSVEAGMSSPLGISLMVHRDGTDERWDGWVDPGPGATFTVADVQLELVDYHYGKRMTLRIK